MKDTVVTNDRWGSNVICKHGGFLTCTDQYSPGKCISVVGQLCKMYVLTLLVPERFHSRNPGKKTLL